MANETTTYKAIAVPTRLLLHPTEDPQLGGDALRAAAETATHMRRTTTSGQTWRTVLDIVNVREPADLRVDAYIATAPEHQSSLLMREDGVILLSQVDDATAGILCHLAKQLHTTFSLAPLPAGVAGTAALFRETRASVIGRMKKGPFRDSYHWTNVAHVNEGPDVVKRYKIKTGEIAPDADKKADAKAKKAAATKEKAAATAGDAPPAAE